MPHSIRFSTQGIEESELLLESVKHESGLSALGETQLRLLSADSEILPDDLLGRPALVTIAHGDEVERHVHGYVTRLALCGRRGRHYGYEATVMPWAWFLSRRTDCRVFQNQTVPDIVKAVFGGHKIPDFRFVLFREYRERVYCVQYLESDLDFVMRLLEEEGIYWYFEHSEHRHTMVLVDSASAHDPEPGCTALPYLEGDELAPAIHDKDCVHRWAFARHVKTGKVVLKDYDFEKPSRLGLVDARQDRPHDLSDYELFEYRSESVVQRFDAQQYALDRVEEFQTRFQVHHGQTHVPLLRVGRLLELTNHPRKDQNAKYLLTAATLTTTRERYESNAQAGEQDDVHRFDCDFEAIPASQQFRPKRQTPRPFMRGPQTARVVGPTGGEIHTDAYGRIKVQFSWDRYGKLDDASSCWIRVSQNWGGKGWGGMFIPHVGQEVIVEFLDGDPDQPLVTGRVYNAENMPPVALPAGKTQSIIRDHGGNEIKMEGFGGSQQIKMYSPTGNTTFAIGAPNSPGDGIEGVTDLYFKMTVGQDWRESVRGRKYVLVDKDKHEEILANSSKYIHGDVTEMMFGNKDSTLKGYKTEQIMGYDRKAVLGFTFSYIGGTKTEVIAGVDTKVNILTKNDIIGALNNKLTKGALVDINNASTWKKSPTIIESANQRIEKELNKIQESDNFTLKVVGALKEKIAQLTQAVGKWEAKVDGKYELAAGNIDLKADGTLKVISDHSEFSGQVLVEKDLAVHGDTFKFGNVLVAKK